MTREFMSTRRCKTGSLEKAMLGSPVICSTSSSFSATSIPWLVKDKADPDSASWKGRQVRSRRLQNLGLSHNLLHLQRGVYHLLQDLLLQHIPVHPLQQGGINDPSPCVESLLPWELIINQFRVALETAKGYPPNLHNSSFMQLVRPLFRFVIEGLI